MRIVELRIHGVSGTPPQDMLTTDRDHPLTAQDVTQVAGDTQVGFYQRVSPAWPDDPDRVLEAYHWGQLTSGSWTKSLWLLLVPFGLVNMAQFMLPDGVRGIGRGFRLVAEAMLRLLGLIMTVVLTLATAEAAADQVAWQWTGLPASGQAVARWADPRGWLLAALAVSALVPLLILWFAGAKAPGAGEPVAPIAARDSGFGLLDDEFDVGDTDIPTLRNLHLAAVWSVLGLLGLCLHGATEAARTGWRGTAWWICLAVAVAAAVAVVLVGNPHRPPRIRRAVVQTVGIGLAVLGLLALLTGMIAVLTSTDVARGVQAGCPAGSCGRGVLPGIASLMFWVLVAGLVSVVVLAAAGGVLAWTSASGPAASRPFRRYLLGMTSPVLASVGVFLGVGFGAAIVFATQHALQPLTAAGFRPALPSLVQRIAHAWGVTAVLMAGLGGIVLVLERVQRATFEDAVRTAHNDDPYRWGSQPWEPGPQDRGGLQRPRDLTGSEIRTVASAWWLARIKLHVQLLVLVFAVVGFLLTLVTGLAAVGDLTSRDPGHCVDDRPPSSIRLVGALVSCTTYGGTALVAAGSLLLLGLGAGLIYLGRRSVQNVGVRRGVNVVWDIVAFWPRAAHPLVPPPYTAKGIDQLRRRVYYWLGLCACPARHVTVCTCVKAEVPVDRVVLAAHSQGTLVTVAALLGLRIAGLPGVVEPTDALAVARRIRPRELAFVTFGAQLQLAYSRGFPRYVSEGLLRELLALLDPRWIGLLRETDPIGGQVLSADRSPLYRGPDAPGPDARPSSWRLADGRRHDDEFVDGVRRCGPEWRLLDPVPSDGETSRRRATLQHSGYFLDPAWETAIGLLRTP